MREVMRRWAAYLDADDRYKEVQRDYLVALSFGDGTRVVELQPVGRVRQAAVAAAYHRFVEWETAHPDELSELEREALLSEALRRAGEASANTHLIELAMLDTGPAGLRALRPN